MEPERFFNFPQSAISKASKIKLVLTDVDGVLTDGGITYDSSGNELKTFNSKDGLGMKLLIKSQLITGIITGRNSGITERRCKELGVKEYFQDVQDKDRVLKLLVKKYGVSAEEVAYIGDDWNDLPVFREIGFRVCPADAHEGVKQVVDFVTNAKGGKGAFRELVDLILLSQGKWMDRFNEF